MDTNELLPGGGLGGLIEQAGEHMTTSGLLASLWWGALGSAFAIYGWKQKSMVPLFAGLVMVAVSYLLWNSALYMSLACGLILAVFFWLRKQGY